MKGIPTSFPASVDLSTLTPATGFTLNGVASSLSGFSVSGGAGDINGDGVADLIIGARDANSNAGASYVVFGKPGIGSTGSIALSSLNGANGFVLPGVANSQSGWSVSGAGDINGDGVADLIIGAYNANSGAGASYVVFGKSGLGSSGSITLSSLNGTNGFVLPSVASSYSGQSVSGAGDVNGDGVADLIIGGPYTNANAGASYVVFGKAGLGSTGSLALSSLNGANGFVLPGVASSESGWSVSGAGDINGDGVADLIIGAHGAVSTDTGASYVVFGKLGLGSSGSITLSSLNGTNGFVLPDVASSRSGNSVSGAGDINGDGVADLIIGAYGTNSNAGASYVVFGKAGLGSTGSLPPSSLNGANGFVLPGVAGSESGVSVSGAGDINGDGVADLIIGAYLANSNAGASYVVFGKPGIGSSGSLALSSLNGSNGFVLPGVVGSYSGTSVSGAGDINGDGVADLIIGASSANSGAGASYVVFGDIPPVLVNNKLNVVAGTSVVLSYNNLAAYDRNHNNQTLIFVPTGISHGYFSTTSAPGIPLANFTQQQVTSSTIQFVHDGTQNPPNYNISVYSAGIAWTGPSSAQISFNLAQGHFPAILPLASLNGQNGFKLDGENSGDYSGTSVSAAGDINGDGYADLLIGADEYPSGSDKGRSYVVFGGLGVGKSGNLLLSSLNGTNGFKLDGENNNDWSGVSVSAAGDINGDGHADLLIGAWGYPNGAYKGRSYVVFGGPGVGKSGDLLLSSLNGTNGFKLDGENNRDASRLSISAAGDINGDGYNDLLIGAWGYPSGGNKGRSYVVFGGPGVGKSGYLLLSSLNGTNGFKLDGENNGDFSGVSISTTGDINGDGYTDLLIGADEYPSGGNKGRSYVVFGGSGVGKSGSLLLSSLNGTNGFKLDGENNGDWSGNPVSAAGDINGDGHTDLVLGVHMYPGGGAKGRSYVVFGGLGVGNSGDLLLSSLNGANGFKLDGENNNDWSGQSVSAAGDINGDGYADLLIGAQGYPNGNYKGRSYVVFGGSDVGKKNGTLALLSLNGANGFKLDGENNNDSSGVSVSAAGDINGDSVDDVLIGAYAYPGGAYKGRSYVVFGDIPPVLVNNRLIISLGSIVPLAANDLSAYDRNHKNNTLVFVPTAVSHGKFELVTQPGIPLVNFTQPQLINGTVRFVHDGSSIAPSYNISVYSAGIAWTGPSAANITITAMPASPTPTYTPTMISTPVLLNNQLTLSDGETVVLSSTNLQAIETGFNASGLTFYISNLQNGYFSLLPTNASVTRFLQSYVQKGQVQFVHSGDHQAPGYSIVVNDGVHATVPSPALIDFLGAPTVVTSTPVTVTQGGSTTLTTSNLNVSNTGGSSASQIVFQVSNVQQSQFILNSTGAPVSNFTLTQLLDHTVQLAQDGSNIAPSYSVAVTGSNGLSSAVTPVSAQLCTSVTNPLSCAPTVVRNNLWIKQGASTALTTQNLYATDSNGQALSPSTVYYVTNVDHGYFDVNGSSSSYFTQQQLQAGVVKFVDDGTNVAPSYQIAVQSSNLQTNSLAQVTLSFVNKPPYLAAGGLLNQVAVVGQPFSLAITSSTFVDPQNDPLILSAGIYNSTQLLPSWLSFNPSTNRFSGTPTKSGVLDIGVTASDPEGLSTVGEFSLTVLGSSAASSSSLTTAIVSSVVSGSIGLFFLLLRIGLQRAASKKLEAALGEGHEYEQKVVRPIAKAIAQRLKITGFMGGTTNHEMLAFKDAVRTLLQVLTNHGVDLEFSKMSEIKRDNVINEIATQTKEYFLPSSRNCCTRSCQSFVSFFKAEVTPQQIRDAAAAIAEAVIQVQKQHQSSAAQMGILSSSQSGRFPPPSPTPLEEDITVASLS